MNPPEPITSIPLETVASLAPLHLPYGTPIEWASATQDNALLAYKTTEGKAYVCCPNCGPVEIGKEAVPAETNIDDLTTAAAKALKEEWAIGSSGSYDDPSFDYASDKEVAAILHPFFAKLITRIEELEEIHGPGNIDPCDD